MEPNELLAQPPHQLLGHFDGGRLVLFEGRVELRGGRASTVRDRLVEDAIGATVHLIGDRRLVQHSILEPIGPAFCICIVSERHVRLMTAAQRRTLSARSQTDEVELDPAFFCFGSQPRDHLGRWWPERALLGLHGRRIPCVVEGHVRARNARRLEVCARRLNAHHLGVRRKR